MRKFRFVILLIFVVIAMSGCASLMQVPFQLIKLPFDILGWTFNLLKKAPMPPPWVFF